jgi:hypothetical protein
VEVKSNQEIPSRQALNQPRTAKACSMVSASAVNALRKSNAGKAEFGDSRPGATRRVGVGTTVDLWLPQSEAGGDRTSLNALGLPPAPLGNQQVDAAGLPVADFPAWLRGWSLAV